jgi:aerobic carbon-monoxide dehydrogenase medium subunit
MRSIEPMRDFAYARPSSLAEAAAPLPAAAKRPIIAGGHTLLARDQVAAADARHADRSGRHSGPCRRVARRRPAVDRRDDHACGCCQRYDAGAAIPAWPGWRAASVTSRCAIAARWAASSPTMTRRRIIRPPCWRLMRLSKPRGAHAADDYFQGMFATALADGEIVTRVGFKRAAGRRLCQVPPPGVALCRSSGCSSPAMPTACALP